MNDIHRTDYKSARQGIQVELNLVLVVRSEGRYYLLLYGQDNYWNDNSLPYEIPDMLLEIPNTAYVFKSNENTNVKRKHNPNSRKESMVPTAVVVAYRKLKTMENFTA